MSNNIEELFKRLKELPIEQQEICADILSSFINLSDECDLKKCTTESKIKRLTAMAQLCKSIVWFAKDSENTDVKTR